LRLVLLLIAGAVSLLQAGCSTVGYYSQAVRGHLDVMGRRQDIEAVIEDPQTDAALRARLAQVLAIRDFASTALGLPENDRYRTFADLERPYVVWNVVATPEFSLAPKRWCFLFVGCLAYKGWFSEEKARREAQRLRARGYDVAVGGVAAYSTLGRFADPFLNTMAGYSEPRVASLVFHELAHQQLYLRGETAFNEAFASFVAEEGVRRWLARRDAAALRLEWETQERRQARFTQLVLGTRAELMTLYARTDLTEAERRAAKAAAFDAMRAAYEGLKSRAWDGYDGYDGWFERVNNAHLASIATYRRLMPAFGALLAQADGDFERFLALAEELAALPGERREARLRALLAVSSGRSVAGSS
jgi:predicted aminopeptidase